MIFESRLVSEIVRLIHEELDARHRDLGRGAMLADDPGVSGMRFARSVGGIAGLRQALALIEQAERNLSIKPKKGDV